MKALFATLILLAGLAQAQVVTIGGHGGWGDTLRWGGAVDSSSSLLVRGNALRRDSLGTWVVNTTDSCSKPSLIERSGRRPIWKYEIQYEVRTSTGNTDSSQVVFRFDTRYCRDEYRSLYCDPWVPAGRHAGYADVTVQDTVLSTATTAGTTWMPTRQLFFLGGGSQLRACVDSYQAGGATNDSTFFRRIIVRYQ